MASSPVVLCILDGWGDGTASSDNAIAVGATPTWDRWRATRPCSQLDASAIAVGLPAAQMGNSEVGHMNIGAGRVVLQDLSRIDAAVADGFLCTMPALTDFMTKLNRSGGACHLFGLLSPGGVHSHQDHMVVLARALSAAGIPVRAHALLDGRDTPPRSADGFIAAFEAEIADLPDVSLTSLCGRYYAMDRDMRWQRTETAYNAYVLAEGRRLETAAAAISANYAKGVSDEFVLPTLIADAVPMSDGDGILMANFRADRVRQILTALLDPEFDAFVRRHRVTFAAALGMTRYAAALDALLGTIFTPLDLSSTLGETVAAAGLRQLRVAETEKYAHVTFFLDGGCENENEGERRVLIPSPQVPTYDLKPEMSAAEVTDVVVATLDNGEAELVVVNYANPDMVGHTGNMSAAKRAVETVDVCLARIETAVQQAGGMLLVTADHGNVEQMRDPETGEPHTAHTLNKVPLVLACGTAEGLEDGSLADVAPTVLAMMGLAVPAEMSGHSLLALAAPKPQRSAAG